MSDPIDPATLVSPYGPVSPELFPGVPSNVLLVNLQVYIDRAYADPRVINEPDPMRWDRIARNLALSMVFGDVFIRMNAQPKHVGVLEKGTHTYDMNQIREMQALSEKYLNEAISLLSVVVNTQSGRRNANVPTVFTW